MYAAQFATIVAAFALSGMVSAAPVANADGCTQGDATGCPQTPASQCKIDKIAHGAGGKSAYIFVPHRPLDDDNSIPTDFLNSFRNYCAGFKTTEIKGDPTPSRVLPDGFEMSFGLPVECGSKEIQDAVYDATAGIPGGTGGTGLNCQGDGA